jgi:hypothetical protein
VIILIIPVTLSRELLLPDFVIVKRIHALKHLHLLIQFYSPSFSEYSLHLVMHQHDIFH